MSRSKKRRNYRSYLHRPIPGPVLRSDPALVEPQDQDQAQDQDGPLQHPPLAVEERTGRGGPFVARDTIEAQGRNLQGRNLPEGGRPDE